MILNTLPSVLYTTVAVGSVIFVALAFGSEAGKTNVNAGSGKLNTVLELHFFASSLSSEEGDETTAGSEAGASSIPIADRA